MRWSSPSVSCAFKAYGVSAILAGLMLSCLPQHLKGQDVKAHSLNAQGAGAPVKAQPSSIAGSLQDLTGAPVPAVTVALASDGNTQNCVLSTDENGKFLFVDLVPGRYRVTIKDNLTEPPTPMELSLINGQQYQLSLTTTQLRGASTSIDVTASENEIATAQVELEEKQKVLGFMPNYYTTYIWDAAPMTPKLKLQLGLRSITDPIAFVTTAGVAALEQRRNTFPGYKQGDEAYARRYGATYADTVSYRMLGSVVFPILLRQDPRYFYQGSGSVRSRIIHALKSGFVARGDNGNLEPNYSHLLGIFAAAGLANVYRSSSDRQVGLTFRNGLILTGTNLVGNILREFLSRKASSNVPEFANGKP